jgi:hypothetical protein
MQHAWGSRIRTKFLLESFKGRGDLGDLGIDGRVILKWILEE